MVLLLIVEKCIRGEICHAIHQYVEANKKYREDYEKNLKSLDHQFNKDFRKNSNQDSDEEYFLEIDFQYLENFHNLKDDLIFLPKKVKTGKVKKLVKSLDDKEEYFVLIIKLKPALNHGLIFVKLHRTIQSLNLIKNFG